MDAGKVIKTLESMNKAIYSINNDERLPQVVKTLLIATVIKSCQKSLMVSEGERVVSAKEQRKLFESLV